MYISGIIPENIMLRGQGELLRHLETHTSEDLGNATHILQTKFRAGQDKLFTKWCPQMWINPSPLMIGHQGKSLGSPCTDSSIITYLPLKLSVSAAAHCIVRDWGHVLSSHTRSPTARPSGPGCYCRAEHLRSSVRGLPCTRIKHYQKSQYLCVRWQLNSYWRITISV